MRTPEVALMRMVTKRQNFRPNLWRRTKKGHGVNGCIVTSPSAKTNTWSKQLAEGRRGLLAPGSRMELIREGRSGQLGAAGCLVSAIRKQRVGVLVLGSHSPLVSPGPQLMEWLFPTSIIPSQVRLDFCL